MVGVDAAVTHDGTVVTVSAELEAIVGVDEAVIPEGTIVAVKLSPVAGMLDAVVGLIGQTIYGGCV